MKIWTLLLSLISIQQTFSISWAENTLNGLTLEEKIGQMFVVAAVAGDHNAQNFKRHQLLSRYKTDPQYIEQLITHYRIGGVIFLHHSTPSQQIDMTNHYQTLSRLPLLIVQDCEWGLSMRVDNTMTFPHAMTLGAVNDYALIYQTGAEIGRQSKALGIHMNCGPVADINNNPANPVIHDRSFGENKERVTGCSLAFAQGLQSAGILSCTKHFPGHGDTHIDSHFALPLIEYSREHLMNNELFPFKHLIENGVDGVMVAHLSIPSLDASGVPATLSYPITTELLQNELGFDGLVITDGLGMEALSTTYTGPEIALKAFLAGNTILLCPLEVPQSIATLKNYIQLHPEAEKLLDHNVLKILEAKEKLGINHHRLINKNIALQSLHTPYAYALKKKLYQKAITLVHGKEYLPIDFSQCAVVIVGDSKTDTFANTLGVSRFCLSPSPTQQELETLLVHLKPYTTVVFGIFEINKRNHITFGISPLLINFIKQTVTQKTVVTLFGTPYAAKLFGNTDTLVVAYQPEPEAQEAAALVIKGECEAQGLLPITLNL